MEYYCKKVLMSPEAEVGMVLQKGVAEFGSSGCCERVLGWGEVEVEVTIVDDMLSGKVVTQLEDSWGRVRMKTLR